MQNEIKQNNMIGGLQPLPRDSRDFSYHKAFGAISELPTESFLIGTPLEIKQQYSTDLCTAFASCSLSEFQEGVILSPEYQFAKTKQIEGDYLTWGADLRTACKSLVKFGSLEKTDSKLDVADDDRDKIANWANWDITDDMKARKHRKQSYFQITKRGHKDLFDALRTALWDNKKAKRAIITGLLWRQNWTYLKGGLVPKYNDKGSYGHSFIFIGQKIIVNEPYLVAQLSNGNIGDQGLYYFPREVVNKECRFGNFMHVDIPPEEVKKVQWGFRQRFINFLINIKK